MTGRCLKCGLEIRIKKPVYLLCCGVIRNTSGSDVDLDLGTNLYLCEDCVNELKKPESIPVISVYRDDVAKYIGDEADNLTTDQLKEISEHVSCGYMDEVLNESLRYALEHLGYELIEETEQE